MFMPFLPEAPILISLGKSVLYFADLERWVATGICEAECIVDLLEQRKIDKMDFGKRATRLRQAFDQQQFQAVDTWFPSIQELQALGDERNLRFHGRPYVVIPATETNAEGAATQFGTALHISDNVARQAQIEHNLANIEDFNKRVENCAQRVSLATMNLGMAKRAKGTASYL